MEITFLTRLITWQLCTYTQLDRVGKLNGGSYIPDITDFFVISKK